MVNEKSACTHEEEVTIPLMQIPKMHFIQPSQLRTIVSSSHYYSSRLSLKDAEKNGILRGTSKWGLKEFLIKCLNAVAHHLETCSSGVFANEFAMRLRTDSVPSDLHITLWHVLRANTL